MTTHLFLFGLMLQAAVFSNVISFNSTQPEAAVTQATNGAQAGDAAQRELTVETGHNNAAPRCILVDTETGKIIENPAKGDPDKVKHYCMALDVETGKAIRIDSVIYEARCSNGTPVMVLDDAMDNPAAQTNAHGITFSGGEYWINHHQVQILLDNDGYTRIADPEPGDIAIFRAKETYMLNERTQVRANSIHHSMIVVGKTETGEPLLVGLKDFETHLKLETPATCFPRPSQVAYYRGEVKERHAVFTILQQYPYQKPDAAVLVKKGLKTLTKQLESMKP